ncbi:hypothetical protein [Chitinophaga qingshengii]|uniref:Uncharacterized protein n=1 Tax=Chitinophaga qingshengii TaxID=1569794 RepID=A0ABR7TF80_9BACT|nr:hypothetical protein [Chitinophaga qingshengii]MBC9928985.1 hypothetical protein [Chitinophaga qingshengii]
MKYTRILIGILAVISFPVFAIAQCHFVRNEAIHASSEENTLKLIARSLKVQHAFKVPAGYRVIPIYKVFADSLSKTDFASGQLPPNLKYTYQQIPRRRTIYLQQDALLVDSTGELFGYAQGYQVYGINSTVSKFQQGLKKLAADIKNERITCLCTIINLKSFNVFRVTGTGITVSDQLEGDTVYPLQVFLDTRWDHSASL